GGRAIERGGDVDHIKCVVSRAIVGDGRERANQNQSCQHLTLLHQDLRDVSCPFRKFHPAWDSRREAESSQDPCRCSQSCTRLGCSSSTCSSRRAGWKPRICFFATNSASP